MASLAWAGTNLITSSITPIQFVADNELDWGGVAMQESDPGPSYSRHRVHQFFSGHHFKPFWRIFPSRPTRGLLLLQPIRSNADRIQAGILQALSLSNSSPFMALVILETTWVDTPSFPR